MRPPFVSVPLATGLKWSGLGWHHEEKMDGTFRTRNVMGCIVVGEQMHNYAFYAFDILSFNGHDCSQFPLSERIPLLDTLALLRPRFCIGSGGEFLESVIARGGEGVVRKRLDQPYGAQWEKCKRSQVFYCRVADLDPSRGSVILADRDSGEKRGRLPLRSRFEQVRVGSILKVEAFGLTAKGMLREARLDRDTENSWLVSL